MENTGITVEQFRDEFVRFQVNLVKVIDEKFKKVGERLDSVDERFDGMDERFDGFGKRFSGIDEKFVDMGNRIGLCATKEQFTLLEKGIAQVSGKLLQIENNMKVFVVREELPQDILSRMKVKNSGVFAVRDEDKKSDGN